MCTYVYETTDLLKNKTFVVKLQPYFCWSLMTPIIEKKNIQSTNITNVSGLFLFMSLLNISFIEPATSYNSVYN